MKTNQNYRNWCERIREAMKPFRGQRLSTGEIVSAVRKLFPNATPGNVLPADHCAGRDVKISCVHCKSPDEAIFQQFDRGSFLVLGGDKVHPFTSLSNPMFKEEPAAGIAPIAVAASTESTEKTWTHLGRVKAQAGAKAAFDHVPLESGLYKIVFTLWNKRYAYIGESKDLRRRISEYARTPTQGTVSEQVMFDLLTAAGEAELSICCVGLNPREARLKAETAAIAEARAQGLACLNRGEDHDVQMQRFRLEAAERALLKELERVRGKLNALI
jgi:hypothetical protein